ncbi:helix-turn-helix domain-containing protein [Streptomyces sp. NPDC049597]|uniref:TetR/AcrR family transcriptional regulator n=1 Tax=Streptomyces sp. NPDC049597 TaxID=3155276 RepID=UPI00342FF02C
MTSPEDRSRAGETRAQPLEAEAAFADRCFHGTPTRDIASTAGMSPAALYVHHKSKEELLHLISRTGTSRHSTWSVRAIASAPDPAGRRRTLLRRPPHLGPHQRTHREP